MSVASKYPDNYISGRLNIRSDQPKQIYLDLMKAKAKDLLFSSYSLSN